MHKTVFVVCTLWSLVVAADIPEARGRAIALEVDARDQGWASLSADLDMRLTNAQGEESRRTLRLNALEISGDGDQSLIVFDSPRDIAGTGLLSYTHALQPDDQWLYLPALRRVKRIASANKSGPFVGSEFAYEDLTSTEVEKYTYLWLRDERLDEHETVVLEERPAYELSGYTRRVVWIDKAMYQPLKVEFYDRKNALLKTLTLSSYQQYLQRYWRPSKMVMQNHQTGKRTELIWANYVFRAGLTARDFDQNTLKRSR
ncbi:MAG: outer membrane lipoprotein-sorting protein [Gammaproteobacteria bacterium]|nr:outer membrane lipoprotein-sorting protein [Gammaproteobacteria bacterium]